MIFIDFKNLQRFLETISKPSKILSKTFGTKVLQTFFKTQSSKRRFSKLFKGATFGNEDFQRFFEGRNLRVKRWFVNDGSSTSSLVTLQ